MGTHKLNVHRLVLIFSLILCSIIAPSAHAAARELHWDALEVNARLDADGVLDVIERHTMVFTGDWNGGERIFDIRPRQKLELISLERVDANTGALTPLRESEIPRAVDEFAWADRKTLRWRGRLPSDPPFANTPLTYVIHYRLSRILLKTDAQYQLDHDFAFPDRAGSIERFSLGLVLDPVWQPINEFRNRYTAGPLSTGDSFVLKIPLRYTGSGSPLAIDGRRPPAIFGAAAAILAGFALIVLAFVVRERSLGRFVPIETIPMDSAWIEQNILIHPAEVVGAAWDERIGTPEVVALIARMTAEGKLASAIEGKDAMTLHLKVDRNKLDSYERALVDGLFFEDRTETSTKAVQQHYKGSGFNPVSVITPQLRKQVKDILPAGDARPGRLTGIALFLIGAALFVWTAYLQPDIGAAGVVFFIVYVILGLLLQIPGALFRARMDWGFVAAANCMFPAFAVSLGAAMFLWLTAGISEVDPPWTMAAAIAAWTICIANASINGMRSRQSREAIAFRKSLTAARSFFLNELGKPKPDLRDNWYPWLLAFGLGKQVDVWSTQHATTSDSVMWGYNSSSTSSTSSPSSHSTSFTGGGGLSGGAGASATWAAAAAGMASGVSAPSSSSSSDGGGFSSGGSSGGGGGGGW